MDPALPSPYPRRWAALAVLAGAVLLLAIDGTVLALAVPSLARALDPTAAQVLWIGDIYSLVIAGLLVTMGAIGDRYGRKRTLLIGAGAFGLASVWAAYSTSPAMLIAARAALGVAGATLMPATLSLIRTLFPDPRERARAIAWWSAASGGGVALGPLVGGFLLEHFWWGSVFLVNVPVVIVIIVAGAVLLPEARDPQPGRLDLLSALLSILALVPVVYSVKHAAGHGVDGVTLGALAAGLVFGLLFARRQRRSPDPMLDLDLFRIPAFSGAVLADLIAVFALVGLLYFFSQYLQLVRGFEPLQAGLGELPATLASIAVIAIVGAALARLGRGRAIAVGLLLASLGLALIAPALGGEHYLPLGLALIPVGMGIGLAMTLTTDAIVSAVPPRKAGAASAVAETGYELGVALGIAILGSVTTAVYRGSLTIAPGTPVEAARRIEESLASALTVLPADSAGAEAARHAFTHALQTTSWVAAAVTLLAAWVAWRTIPSRPLTADDDAGSAVGSVKEGHGT